MTSRFPACEVLLFFYFFTAFNGVAVPAESNWFPCCRGSVWQQTSGQIYNALELGESRKADMALLAREFSPLVEDVIREKIRQRKEFLEVLGKSLSDGVVTSMEREAVRELYGKLRNGRLEMVSIVIQGKVALDTLLDSGQRKVFHELEPLVTLPSRLNEALRDLSVVLGQASHEYALSGRVPERLAGQLGHALLRTADEICLPADAREVLNMQVRLLAEHADFFMNRQDVEDIAGMDMSLGTMLSSVEEILKAAESGPVNPVYLLGMSGKALGLPAANLLSSFGAVTGPIVMETFMLSPVALGCVWDK